MKKIRTKFLPLLLALVTILSLLPTSAFAASKTGSGIQITQNQAYWSTRLLANGTPYSYRPPLADGKLVYCMDSGLGYHYATKSFLDSFTWTSGSGADADAVLQSAITNSGLSEMDAMTIENVKWMMTYLNDCKASNVGQLFMAVQTYVWENQSYKGEPGGDGDAGGYANADTYELYLSLIDDLLAKKAAEDAEFLKQIEAYKAQGIEASIVEDASAKWAVFAISSNRKNQSFFNYYGPRKLSVGEAKPDQPEQPTGGTGKITLKKTAAGTLKGLPGARYSIYFNGQIVGSDVTGESGELHIEDAATGLWTFVETAAPSGYCLDPTPKSVYVDVSEGDREYTVAAVNYAMPSMIIYKEDAQTSAPVPGTVLSVKSVTGAYSTSVKIGESGSATLEGLEPGVYVVSEESVPEPYILSNTEQTVALRPGKTTEVHFQDYKKPGLEILKKNIANMDPIPDMTYKVEQIDGSFETTVTTDLRGRAFLADLPVGSYRISEVGGPSNVILSEIPQVIYLEAGCTRTVTFFNAIKPTLTILKQNSVTSDPLPGAKLHIYYASDNTSTGEMHDLGVFYSNEEGKVILTDAERGWYKIVEESCPQGFGFLDGEAVQEFYLEENTSKTVIIRNVPLSALVGFKYDTKTGKGIPGCRFELRYLSGNTSGTGGTVIGTYVTGPNGAFTVTGLKKGTYICEEVSSDGNHIIDSEPQTVWISGEDQDVVIIRFGNSPFGSLLITKLSDDNKRSPIPNTDFLLTYSDGTFVGNDNGIYTTNAAGEILVDGLEPGVTIIVREVRAAAGFLLDESPQHIQIKSGETVHLQFLNKPLGNLIIKKNSSAPTQEAVPGAEFEITYADGSYVDAAGGTISSNGRYVTDEHGEIRISGIVGTVVVTEIKSGPGYQLDEANRTQTVTINPGDTQTLQFYNTPISKVEFIKVDENDRSVRIRGFNMSVQVAVQSLSQWKEKYPGMEWENQLGSFDMTLYMGCNDMTSAEYFAKKCGKVTISVTNNQFPLAPLFSPIYSTTRPYSQTRSNTQRDLLQPDEFLRLDKFKCIVMFNHYKPAELYKIMLEELPAYKELVKCSVFDYVPEWKRREDENKKRTPQKTASVPHETSEGHSPQAAAHFVQQENTSEKKQVPDREKACTRKPHAVAMPRQKSGEQCIYDFSDMKEGTSPEDIGLVEMTRSAVIGEDEPDLEELDDPSRIPPGCGI